MYKTHKKNRSYTQRLSTIKNLFNKLEETQDKKDKSYFEYFKSISTLSVVLILPSYPKVRLSNLTHSIIVPMMKYNTFNIIFI